MSINKVQEYLGLADVDYLAARLLILNGMPTVGLSKSAEAIEKQFKLFFLVYEKVANNRGLTTKELRKKGHNLLGMLGSYNSLVPEQNKIGEDWHNYLKLLQDSYDKRYPENWSSWEASININELDSLYVFLRNLNVRNFPVEIKDRALDFGTFLGDVWKEETIIDKIISNGLKLPMEVLRLSNKSFDSLNIKKEKD